MRRILLRLLIGVCVLVACLGAAFAYFLYAPAPDAPTLSASIKRGTVRVGALERSYAFYVPARLATRPPLLIALHGSMGNAGSMRRATAYRFEELADEQGFVLAYPEGYDGHWNDCRKQGPYEAKRLGIDDVGFMRALIAHFRATHDVDSTRVFAAGISNGGHLSYRLALEAPEVIRGVAVVAANLPAPANFDCAPTNGSGSVLIINGTDDPINPFGGGRVTVFGFGDRGDVLSASESAVYFARRNGMTDAPVVERIPQQLRGPTSVERSHWSSPGDDDVMLYTIHGGGHTMPQARARFPRLLGRTHEALDAPAEIWAFFARTGRPHAPVEGVHRE